MTRESLPLVVDDLSTFAGWTGACSGTAATCQVTMSQAHSVTATFTGDPGHTPAALGP